MYQRSSTHMNDARLKYKTSHIYQHLEQFHKGEDLNARESFQFEALGQVRGAMNRQIAEVLLIKNSKSVLMNDRDM